LLKLARYVVPLKPARRSVTAGGIMRIVFMGTAELACPSLKAVATMPRHQIVAVITQPDRPRGRHLTPAPPAVKAVAIGLGLNVVQPARIRDEAAVEALRALQPDLIIVVAYGQLLPKNVLGLPPHGCVNVHTSLLPRWRGASPIQYAILAGDRETGVTTMYLNERLDAGDIILQRAEPIHPDDTAATLHNRLATLGAGLLVETLELINAGRIPRTPQDEKQVTYANKLAKEDGRVDWTKPAVEIDRQIRAFDPWPSAYTFWGDTMLKLWKTEVVTTATGKPGEILPGFVIATGSGGLRLLEVQPANGKRLSIDAFARGYRLETVVILHNAPGGCISK
jgi:methionyl-tRNA formyltransferase